MDPRWARLWFVATAAVVATGVVIGMVLSAQHATFVVDSKEMTRLGGSPLARALNNLAFFTIQSNLIVGATSLLLALNPNRSSMVFRVTVVPVMALAGWVMFRPRRLTSAGVAQLTVLYPLAYMVFTVIRGPLASDWYPYPFADVATLGYGRVLVNALWIGLLFVAVAGTLTAVDKRLTGDSASTPASAAAPS